MIANEDCSSNETIRIIRGCLPQHRPDAQHYGYLHIQPYVRPTSSSDIRGVSTDAKHSLVQMPSCQILKVGERLYVECSIVLVTATNDQSIESNTDEQVINQKRVVYKDIFSGQDGLLKIQKPTIISMNANGEKVIQNKTICFFIGDHQRVLRWTEKYWNEHRHLFDPIARIKKIAGILQESENFFNSKSCFPGDLRELGKNLIRLTRILLSRRLAKHPLTKESDNDFLNVKGNNIYQNVLCFVSDNIDCNLLAPPLFATSAVTLEMLMEVVVRANAIEHWIAECIGNDILEWIEKPLSWNSRQDAREAIKAIIDSYIRRFNLTMEELAQVKNIAIKDLDNFPDLESCEGLSVWLNAKDHLTVPQANEQNSTERTYSKSSLDSLPTTLLGFENSNKTNQITPIKSAQLCNQVVRMWLIPLNDALDILNLARAEKDIAYDRGVTSRKVELNSVDVNYSEGAYEVGSEDLIRRIENVALKNSLISYIRYPNALPEVCKRVSGQVLPLSALASYWLGHDGYGIDKTVWIQKLTGHQASSPEHRHNSRGELSRLFDQMNEFYQAVMRFIETKEVPNSDTKHFKKRLQKSIAIFWLSNRIKYIKIDYKSISTCFSSLNKIHSILKLVSSTSHSLVVPSQERANPFDSGGVINAANQGITTFYQIAPSSEVCDFLKAYTASLAHGLNELKAQLRACERAEYWMSKGAKTRDLKSQPIQYVILTNTQEIKLKIAYQNFLRECDTDELLKIYQYFSSDKPASKKSQKQNIPDTLQDVRKNNCASASAEIEGTEHSNLDKIFQFELKEIIDMFKPNEKSTFSHCNCAGGTIFERIYFNYEMDCFLSGLISLRNRKTSAEHNKSDLITAQKNDGAVGMALA